MSISQLIEYRAWTMDDCSIMSNRRATFDLQKSESEHHDQRRQTLDTSEAMRTARFSFQDSAQTLLRFAETVSCLCKWAALQMLQG